MTETVLRAQPAPGSSRAGATLLELVFYIVFFVSLGVPLVASILVATRSASENSAELHVGERNRMVIFRLENEIRQALATTLKTTADGKGLQFNLPGAFDGNAAAVGDPIQYEIRLLPGETANGIDDNQNGLADEAEIERRNIATSEAIVLSAGIDYNASSFAVSGDAAIVTIATVSALRDANATFSLSRSLTVHARN
jgi:hypothetical protein